MTQKRKRSGFIITIYNFLIHPWSQSSVGVYYSLATLSHEIMLNKPLLERQPGINIMSQSPVFASCALGCLQRKVRSPRGETERTTNWKGVLSASEYFQFQFLDSGCTSRDPPVEESCCCLIAEWFGRNKQSYLLSCVSCLWQRGTKEGKLVGLEFCLWTRHQVLAEYTVLGNWAILAVFPLYNEIASLTDLPHFLSFFTLALPPPCFAAFLLSASYLPRFPLSILPGSFENLADVIQLGMEGKNMFIWL